MSGPFCGITDHLSCKRGSCAGTVPERSMKTPPSFDHIGKSTISVIGMYEHMQFVLAGGHREKASRLANTEYMPRRENTREKGLKRKTKYWS